LFLCANPAELDPRFARTIRKASSSRSGRRPARRCMTATA